jgi:signal transduction histidine kinase
MKYIFVCVFLLFFYTVFGQFPAILNKEDNSISEGFMVLPDTLQRFSIDNVRAPSRLAEFRPVSQSSVQPLCDTYWIHIKLLNGTGFDEEWVTDFQNWSFVNAYIIDRNGKIDSSHKTGHLYPYSKRDYGIANKAYLLLPIRADSSLECFIRLQLHKNSDITPASISFKVISRRLADAENGRNGKMIYAFLAIFLIMFIYNLFIFLSVRLKSYAYYLALLLVMFYTTASNSGYIIEIFGKIDSLPVWLLYFDQFSSSILGFYILLFGAHFLQVKDRYPAWQKIINIIIILFVLTGIVGVVNTRTGMVGVAIPMAATTICIIWLAIKSIKDKYTSAGYFLAGYTTFLISTVPIPLALLNIIPVNIWTMSYSVAIGSIIEIVLFSFALTDLINTLRNENYENQKKQQALHKEQEKMQILFQQELLKTQLEIQEQTFLNISQEIHDNIGQILSLIKINIENMAVNMSNQQSEKLAETKSLIIKVISDIRNLSKILNADFINRIGLPAAIEQQLNLLRKTGQFEIQFGIHGEVTDYDAQSELVIFRIVQELLNNIIKHSEASIIVVSIHYQPEKLTIVVNDNGKGFDIFKAQSANNSLGLLNIKNRIKMVNGYINFDSQLQKGTTVLIELPGKYTAGLLYQE